ncbi:MAG: Rrf2 family transcriptional regulator [Treponema sp.]|jgi:Rrf2 family protein|nr:Rrf2 family transcriptional regulator [Treponema sp.]
MKISSRGRYGIRLLVDLAEHTGESHTALAAAAERKGISIRYLEQVAIILRRSGFIRSVKGASGGYVLARPAQDIILGDVLRVLEGDMLVVDPPLPGSPENSFQRCVRTAVFDRMNEGIARVIDKKSLAEIVCAEDDKESLMYFI